MGGTSYLVGEQGPELFTPSSAGNITPNHALGGGGTINITVTSADPNEVVRALQTYVRQSGPVPVNTRTM
jgi:phage-related minor tail protein